MVIRAVQISSARISIVASASRHQWRDEMLPRVAAAGGSVVLLALSGKFLLGPLYLPAPVIPADARVQLVFSMRPPPDDAVPAVSSIPVPPSLPQRPARPENVPAPVVRAPLPPAATGTTSPAVPIVQLYGEDGRPRLPDAASDRWAPPPADAPGSAATGQEEARRLLDPPNPVEVRSTRFAKDWISDGDVADVAQQEILRAQRRIAEFLFGGDIVHARARPSPEVRFNPARHERKADLGNEATGDAYKAAPISYQPAPGLEGEASRRIREQVAALETAYAGCDRARLRQLMQPLLVHLDELQKAEAAYARGADPVRAEHMLPNAANMAYDMARRALWYADSRLAGCAG